MLNFEKKIPAGTKGLVHMKAQPFGGAVTLTGFSTPFALPGAVLQVLVNDRVVGSVQLEKVQSVTFTKPVPVQVTDTVALALHFSSTKPPGDEIDFKAEIAID